MPILLALGAAVGALNGLLIVVLRVPPVVVTLSMYFILIGVNLRVAAVRPYLTTLDRTTGRLGRPDPGRAVHHRRSRSSSGSRSA